MRTTTVTAALVLLTLGISSAKEPLRLDQTYNLFDFGYERSEYRGDVGNALGSGDVFFITPGFGVEVFGRFGGDWADQYGAGVRFAW